MSRINDALKRAQQAQDNQPGTPAAGPKLKPIEPQPRRPRNFRWVFPASIFTSMGLMALLMWHLSQKNAARNAPPMPAQNEVAANNNSAPPSETMPAPPAAPAPTPQPVAASPESLAPTPAVTAKIASAPAASSSPAAAAAPPPAPAAAPAATGAIAVAAPPTPPPAPQLDPPRLQGIVFHPTRPWAIIGGKSVFVGDKVGGFRVREIKANHVTLVTAGQTNVLYMQE